MGMARFSPARASEISKRGRARRSYRQRRMKHFALLLLTLLFAPSGRLPAADTGEPALPFDRAVINRYSLDHLPRSLSIRQGANVWLGYDLERATVFKAWQAPPGQPGLATAGFVTRSVGAVWFEDSSDAAWRIQRQGKMVPLAIRYLGCSQRADHFALSWELRHEGGALKLHERVPMAAAPATERVVRELRVESLAAGEVLLPPAANDNSWKLTTHAGSPATALTGPEWHRLTLP